MRSALITGSRGFIGRHFVAELERRGWYVSGCDTADGDDCRDLFASTGYRWDLVIHCAANVGGRARIDGDPLAIAENLAIDSDMFRWAVRTKQPRVVYFSSSAAYPVSLQDGSCLHDLHEDDISFRNIGAPDQTYGWSKLTGELLAQQAAAEGVAVHVLRPFSGYGTDQSLDYPFPSFVDRALRRTKLFQVWGDGKQTRDFIHVDDIVRLVMVAVENDVDGTFNLCTGRRTSFNDLASMVCTAVGHELRLDHLQYKPVGVRARVGDPNMMRACLGEPRVSLEEGIYRAVHER